jgi:isoaspartyl peptidase/L-asparaginase-like protein (Ntn-hydrolase superfamily)
MSDTAQLVLESGELALPAVVVHAGAGEFARGAPALVLRGLEAGLQSALLAAWEVLEAGGPALEAAIEAVASFEASGIFNAGRGAVGTCEGTVETDAAVMDGRSGATGAICSASFPDSPVRAAQAVLSLGGPGKGPILLAGAGADRFCEQAGLLRRDPHLLVGEGVTPLSPSGTVGAVALDIKGHLAAATSTGGRLGKLPGRVGDAPIIGAGTWADDKSAAISATGEGESFIVAGFAHRIEWALAGGVSLRDALGEALGSVRARGGHGGGIVLLPNGHFSVGFDTHAMARGWRDRAGSTARVLREPPA